jgi:hypothetical protein
MNPENDLTAGISQCNPIQSQINQIFATELDYMPAVSPSPVREVIQFSQVVMASQALALMPAHLGSQEGS